MSIPVEIAKLASFLLFLFLGVRLMRARGEGRRRARWAFIGYVLVINLFAGLTQFDNWPFTNNILAVGRAVDTAPVDMTIFCGVTADGREWLLDPYAFSPVFESILSYWVDDRYPRLAPAERREAERFLLAKANESRARLARGERIGFDRLAGPLNSPYWWLRQRQLAAPSTPYVALRLVREHFVPRDLERDPRSRKLTLLMEWR